MAASDDKKPGLFARLRSRLNRGNSILTRDLGDLLPGGRIDEDTLEELETRLLMADVGIEATEHILEGLRSRLRRSELADVNALLAALRAEIVEILKPCEQALEIPKDGGIPFVIMSVGINGAGKTTTLGKLARRFKDAGHSVMLAAGDTFRAAAIEQLQAWGERNGVPVIAQAHGADPAAVAHDAWQAAVRRDADVLMVDTAGRLHTQQGLMDELAKVRRVLQRCHPQAPQEVLLVLDGGIGQNALVQARQFHQAVGVTGLAITKLDGSAKGGVLLAIARELALPIRYIGIGESAEDLQPFDAEAFAAALAGDGDDHL
ncbi:MAG TPA: signal recognition particle-docking protein FtsY [Gammaproteobacteria bacterium]|nr:signal recognition particle-docking protein FtsY [Gammaproteobacteria bacterium]